MGGAARLFFFFPCPADHERDWPPCKVLFFELATNALNVRNNNLNIPPDWGMLRRIRCVHIFLSTTIITCSDCQLILPVVSVSV